MIEFHTWMTPNGQKVAIMLEEVALPYRVHPIDITKDEQFDPAFLKVAPNNKIPAIIDTDTGLHLMESGAILLYLAEKTGMLWPQEFPAKWRVVEWLMWQMGGTGPIFGQVHHFVRFNPGKSAYAEERYTREARRLWSVLERRLDEAAGHCSECHSSRNILGGIVKAREFAGALNPEGKGGVPNITPSEDGIGDWTIEDIAYLLETGTRRTSTRSVRTWCRCKKTWRS